MLCGAEDVPLLDAGMFQVAGQNSSEADCDAF